MSHAPGPLRGLLAMEKQVKGRQTQSGGTRSLRVVGELRRVQQIAKEVL